MNVGPPVLPPGRVLSNERKSNLLCLEIERIVREESLILKMLDLLFKMSDGQGSFVWLSHLTGGEMEAGSAWAQDKDLGLPLPPPRPVSAHLCHTED